MKVRMIAAALLTLVALAGPSTASFAASGRPLHGHRLTRQPRLPPGRLWL